MLRIFERPMWLILFVTAVGLAAPATCFAQADEPSEKKTEKQAAKESADKDQKKADAEEKNPYALPEDATPEELGEFLNSLMRRRPRTRQQAVGWYGARLEASNLILAGDVKGELAKQAAQAKLQSLQVLPRMDRGYEGETAEEFTQSLLESDDEKLVLFGRVIQLQSGVRRIARMNESDRGEYVDEVFSLIKESGLDGDTYRLASGIASSLGRVEDTQKLGAEVYERLAELSKDDESYGAGAAKLAGAARRLRLVGNPIELQGPTIDGEEFDWSAYKGKIVLIDFWAVWCGPCVAEVPNMKKNYEAYKDRGFDIVGINMDRDPSRCEKFVEDRELAWAQIMGTEDANYWNHPLANYFGVMGIPTQILVGRDGNVISITARGRRLDSLLEELMGDSEGAKDGDEEDAKKKDAERAGE